jgi:aminopeptidase N
LKIKVSYENGQLVVHAKQTQKVGETALFRVPLQVRVGYAQAPPTSHERTIDTTSDALVVATDVRPAWVEIDPDFRIIGSLSISAPGDMLRTQLQRGSTARARWLAARALADKDDMLSIEALGGELANEEQAWMVRAEIARALGRIRGNDAFAWLESHAKTKHPKVRRGVVSALGRFRTAAAVRVLSERCRSDQSYLVKAAAAEALGSTRQAGVSVRLKPLLKQDSWADVVRAGALRGMGRSRDETALDEVLRMTEYGTPTRARRAAVAQLPELGEGRRVREHLEQLLDDAFPHVRISVIAALEQLGDPKVRGILRRHLGHELDGRVLRRCREALRGLSETGTTQRKKLVDEVEALRNDFVELKLKLSKLEGGHASKSGQSPLRPHGGPSRKARPERASTGGAKPKRSAKKEKGASRQASKNAGKKTAPKKTAPKKTAPKKTAASRRSKRRSDS